MKLRKYHWLWVEYKHLRKSVEAKSSYLDFLREQLNKTEDEIEALRVDLALMEDKVRTALKEAK